MLIVNGLQILGILDLLLNWQVKNAFVGCQSDDVFIARGKLYVISVGIIVIGFPGSSVGAYHEGKFVFSSSIYRCTARLECDLD